MVPHPLRKAIAKLGALLERQGLDPDLNVRLRRVAQHLDLVVAESSVAAQMEALVVADVELQGCLAALGAGTTVDPEVHKELRKVGSLVSMLTRPATGKPRTGGRARGRRTAEPLPPTVVLPGDEPKPPTPAPSPPVEVVVPPEGATPFVEAPSPTSPAALSPPPADPVPAQAAALLEPPPALAHTPLPAAPPGTAAEVDTEPGAPPTGPAGVMRLFRERWHPADDRRARDRRYYLLILGELNSLADTLRRLRGENASPASLEKAQARCLLHLRALRFCFQDAVPVAWEFARTETTYPEDVFAPALVLAALPPTMDDRTQRWLAGLGDEQKQALAAAGFDELVARLRPPEVDGERRAGE